MALIGIEIPLEFCKELRKINVPGKLADPDSYHITMFYFPKSPKLKNFIEIAETLYKKVPLFKPFTIRCKKISSFPKGPDGIPIILPITSPTLFEIREIIAKALDKIEAPYSKKFPEYKPHIILSYHKDQFEDRELPSDISFKVSDICCWAADDHRSSTGVQLSIPLLGEKLSSLQYGTEIFFKLS